MFNAETLLCMIQKRNLKLYCYLVATANIANSGYDEYSTLRSINPQAYEYIESIKTSSALI